MPWLQPVPNTFPLSGALLIDEAVDVGKTISNGDSSAVLWAHLPLWHASTDKFTVKNNKRMLEDKLMQSLANGVVAQTL